MLVGILQGGQVLLGLAIAYLVVAHGLASPSATPVDEDRAIRSPEELIRGAAAAGAFADGGRRRPRRSWRGNPERRCDGRRRR